MQRLNRAIGITFAMAFAVGTIPAASAGSPIDPDTLTPAPPAGASCQQTGPSAVVCQTAISVAADGVPLFDIGCGTVYETSTEDLVAIRWYADGLLVRRFIRGDMAGTWGLTPDASGRAIPFVGHWTQHDTFSVPGDPDTVVEDATGLAFHATDPRLGADLILAGRIEPDGTLHGVNRVDEPLGEISPASIATLESVLCD
ncbi:MAG TPA: hypothetical protein VFI34_06980 [Candidatus Limnocylindrales bacterium]|nr:hypothetical protein [Candidatus Limnocylindrales bacterium]